MGSAILAPCRKGAWHQHKVSCKRCAGAKLPSADIDSGAAVLTTRHCCLIALSILVFLRHNSSGPHRSAAVLKRLPCLRSFYGSLLGAQANAVAPSAQTDIGAIMDGTSPQNFYPVQILVDGRKCHLQQDPSMAAGR